MGENIINVFEQNVQQAGFIKKRGSWYFNGAETILVVNLQKSNYGKQYYVNLAVYVKQFGEERFPKERVDWAAARLDQVSSRELGRERTGPRPSGTGEQ